MSALTHLNKYAYIFEAECKKPKSTFPIPYIWQCWLQGKEQAPDIIRACLHSVQKYQPKHTIKVLDMHTVHDFIHIPQYILDKFHQNIIPPAHFTDYIRVALLAKYGGTWIDATIFLSESIPNTLLKEDFFAYKFPPWCGLPKKTLPDFARIFSGHTRDIDKRCFSNWLIHAKANNRLMQLTQAFLEEYWAKENTLFDYYMFHLFCTYAILQDSLCQESFVHMVEASNAYPHLLQQCLLQPYDEKLYTSIKNATPVHKLTHKIMGEVPAGSFAHHIINTNA